MIDKYLAKFLIVISLCFGFTFGLFIGSDGSIKATLNKDNMIIKTIEMNDTMQYTYTFFDNDIVLSSKNKYNIGDTLYINNGCYLK